MAELILEPYAVVQHWHLPDANGHWEAILAEYLQTLAQRCSASSPAVIGHIKALALFPDQNYWRGSIVAANLPVSMVGQVPLGCTDLELTLNVLVYGLGRAAIEQITQAAAQEAAAQWKGVITPTNQNPSSQHVHHSNPQEQKERNDE